MSHIQKPSKITFKPNIHIVADSRLSKRALYYVLRHSIARIHLKPLRPPTILHNEVHERLLVGKPSRSGKTHSSGSWLSSSSSTNTWRRDFNRPKTFVAWHVPHQSSLGSPCERLVGWFSSLHRVRLFSVVIGEGKTLPIAHIASQAARTACFL